MADLESQAVVIVEDDASVCQAIERLLRLGGFKPKTYPSAETLLANGDLGKVGCLVVDVQLPGMSGFALHERLAARGMLPPVIFITAFDVPEARAKAAQAGAAALLAKPFTGRSLLNTIRTALGRD
jgi:FixJ family two-component response regulator